MATLDITQEPGGTQGWALAKEQMIYGLELLDLTEIQGDKHIRTITINAGGVVGETLIVSAPILELLTGTASHTLTVDTDGIGDLSIKAFSSSQTIAEWIDEALLPALNGCSKFEGAFTFTRSSNRLVIRAVSFNTESGDYTTTVTGTLDITDFSDTAPTLAPELSIVNVEARVFVTTGWASGEYVGSPWLGYAMEVSGGEAALSHDFSPEYSALIESLDKHHIGSNYRKPTDSVRKGYIQFRFRTSDDAIYTRSKTICLLKGGREVNLQATSYLTGYVGNGSTPPQNFLTSRPKELYTHRRVQDYLSFHARWNVGSSLNILVKVTVYYTNGSTLGDTKYTITPTDAENHQIVTIPAGYDQLDMDYLSPGDTPYKYEITVELDGGTLLKQTYRLVPDTDTGASLLYHNEFGLPEGVWCEGTREWEVKYRRSSMSVSKPTTTLTDWLEDVSFARSRQPSVTLSTLAMVPNEWKGYLALVNSKQLWLRVDGESRDYPVQLVSGSAQIRPTGWDGDNAKALNVEVVMNAVYG